MVYQAINRSRKSLTGNNRNGQISTPCYALQKLSLDRYRPEKKIKFSEACTNIVNQPNGGLWNHLMQQQVYLTHQTTKENVPNFLSE